MPENAAEDWENKVHWNIDTKRVTFREKERVVFFAYVEPCNKTHNQKKPNSLESFYYRS